MDRPMRRRWGEALAWLAFPVVPVVLGDFYYGVLNLSVDGYGGPDPYDWDWHQWLRLLGPLLGFGFLAGATLDVPDDPKLRGWRSWRSRRSLWVAVGPWAGFLVWTAGYFLVIGACRAFPRLDEIPLGDWWSNRVGEPVKWVANILFWALVATTFYYAWLLPAVAALRRARARGRLLRALQRGLAVMAAFVGSLFGSFWAVTQAWRTFFFDRTIIPVLLVALGLVALSGCSATVSYGEVRRRELFHALLVSWLFGLALFWRWWSRPRRKP